MKEILIDDPIFLPLPICDVCDRPIDRLETFFDPTKGARGEHRLIAHCHGDQERVAIDSNWYELLTAQREVTVSVGRAFVKNLKYDQLPSPTKMVLRGR